MSVVREKGEAEGLFRGLLQFGSGGDGAGEVGVVGTKRLSASAFGRGVLVNLIVKRRKSRSVYWMLAEISSMTPTLAALTVSESATSVSSGAPPSECSSHPSTYTPTSKQPAAPTTSLEALTRQQTFTHSTQAFRGRPLWRSLWHFVNHSLADSLLRCRTRTMASLVNSVIDVVVSEMLREDVAEMIDEGQAAAAVHQKARRRRRGEQSRNSLQHASTELSAKLPRQDTYEHLHALQIGHSVGLEDLGCGNSAVASFASQQAHTTADLTASAAEMTRDISISIVGLSYGGMVAQHLAPLRNDVECLVLLSTSNGMSFKGLLPCVYSKAKNAWAAVLQKSPCKLCSRRSSKRSKQPFKRTSSTSQKHSPAPSPVDTTCCKTRKSTASEPGDSPRFPWHVFNLQGGVELALLAAAYLIAPYRAASDLNELWLAQGAERPRKRSSPSSKPKRGRKYRNQTALTNSLADCSMTPAEHSAALAYMRLERTPSGTVASLEDWTGVPRRKSSMCPHLAQHILSPSAQTLYRTIR